MIVMRSSLGRSIRTREAFLYRRRSYGRGRWCTTGGDMSVPLSRWESMSRIYLSLVDIEEKIHKGWEETSGIILRRIQSERRKEKKLEKMGVW